MPYVSREKILAQATLEKNREVRQKLLHQIFDGYKASSDWPGHQFANDLADFLTTNITEYNISQHCDSVGPDSIRNTPLTELLNVTYAALITKQQIALVKASSRGRGEQAGKGRGGVGNQSVPNEDIERETACVEREAGPEDGAGTRCFYHSSPLHV